MVNLLKTGKAVVVYEPKGDYSLEGFVLYSEIDYKYLYNDKTGEKYYSVRPCLRKEPYNYYETCSSQAFNRCFKILS